MSHCDSIHASRMIQQEDLTCEVSYCEGELSCERGRRYHISSRDGVGLRSCRREMQHKVPLDTISVPEVRGGREEPTVELAEDGASSKQVPAMPMAPYPK